MKKGYSKETIKKVVSQIIGMYDNNIYGGNGCESFCGWCEDGDVFADEPDEGECIDLMMELAPKVDALTGAISHAASGREEHRIIDTCFGEVMLKDENTDEDGNPYCQVYNGDNYDEYIGEVNCSLYDDDEVIKQQVEEMLY